MKLLILYYNLYFVVFLVCLFAVLLLGNSFSYLDNDFGWHLLSGKEILSTKQVPLVANYSHSSPGAYWVDHEWLIDVLVYLSYEKLGYIATSVFFAIIVMLVFGLLYFKQFSRFNKSNFWFIVVGFLAFFAARHSMGVRMQEITLLCLLLELLIIDNYQKSRQGKKLWWLIPLFIFWANNHAGFLIGLVILFGWLLFMLLLNLIMKWQEKLRFIDFTQVVPVKGVLVFFYWSLAAIFATLINPYGWKMYDFLLSFGNTYYLTALSEWLPFYYFPQQPMVVLFLCLVLSSLILLFVKAINRSADFKVDLWWLSLVLLFLVMALKSRRHVPLLAIISLPWLVDLFSREFVIANAKEFFNSRRIKIITNCGTILVVGVAIYCFRYINFTNKPFDYYCGYFPCEAVPKLKTMAVAPKRILNDFNWGGYLLWQWPGLDLFIDGRQPQLQYEDHTILEEYHQFFKEGEGEKYLKKHQIDIVLLGKPKDPELTWFNKILFGLSQEDLKSNNYLIDYLRTAKGWQNCHEDALAVAFCKI